MTSYLVTGCSRGLGVQLIKQLASLSSTKTIFSTTRSDTPPPALASVIKEAPSKVTIKHLQLDVDDTASINMAVTQVQQTLGTNGLDVLINNAGITFREAGHGPAIDLSSLTAAFNTNVASVHRVTLAFLPLLKQGTQKKIINISSTMGSISTAGQAPPFAPSYKISKSALNMLTAQWALGLKEEGFTVVAISPGWLRTELGGEYAHLSAEEGAKATVESIESAGTGDNGSFRNIRIEGSEFYQGGNPSW